MHSKKVSKGSEYQCIFGIPHHPLLADSSGSGKGLDIVAKQQASVLGASVQ